MTIRPIAFTGAMVSALLDGRKTQTRRVLSIPFLEGINPQHTGLVATRSYGSTWQVYGTADASKPFDVRYEVGDLLYVRECWRTPESLDHLSPRQIAERCDELGYRGRWCPRVTEADDMTHQWSEEDGFRDDEPTGRLRAAMHMPRWASRLTLKVTDVRVERVKQISEADARAEGLAAISKDGKLFKFGIPDRDGYPGNDDYGWHWPDWEVDPRAAFRTLWDSINAPRGFGWDANPWVVAVSFELIRANVDQLPGPQAKAEDTERERSGATTTRTGQ